MSGTPSPPPRDPRGDRALLAAHLAGDGDAFGELVARYTERLWRLAFRTLDHREDASDVLQETFLSALRSAAGYRGESEVSTWLHRILVNACMDRIRRRRLRAAEPLGGHDLPTPRDPIADRLTAITVAEALTMLPADQRLAVILIDMEGFSFPEAAAILGAAEGTVKSRNHRGRVRLAMLLGHLRPPAATREYRPRDRSRTEERRARRTRGNREAAGDVPSTAGESNATIGPDRTGGSP